MNDVELRAERLLEAARASRLGLSERELEIDRLRTQIAALREEIRSAERAPIVVSTPTTVSAPTFAAVAAPITPHPVRRVFWTPYAAIAACAFMLEVGGARRPPSTPPDLTAFARPAPEAVSGVRVEAKGAPIVSDDDRSSEALAFVQEWSLPGEERPLGERFGGVYAPPGAESSWRVERTGTHGYRVTFQSDSRDLPYAFETDIEARVVWPTPETQELLGPRYAVAFRDAVHDVGR